VGREEGLELRCQPVTLDFVEDLRHGEQLPRELAARQEGGTVEDPPHPRTTSAGEVSSLPAVS